MGSDSRTAYPLELLAGTHRLVLEALLGSIALVRTRELGSAYLADLNRLQGQANRVVFLSVAAAPGAGFVVLNR